MIWKRDAARHYMECLLMIATGNPEDNNLESIRSRIAELGYRTGALLGRYLTSAFDQRPREYYHAWIEVDLD